EHREQPTVVMSLDAPFRRCCAVPPAFVLSASACFSRYTVTVSDKITDCDSGRRSPRPVGSVVRQGPSGIDQFLLRPPTRHARAGPVANGAAWNPSAPSSSTGGSHARR